MDAVEPERVADGLHLAMKSSTVQKSVGFSTHGAAAADLVVEDHAPAGGGERLERLEVVVQRTRAAVEGRGAAACRAPRRRRRCGTRSRRLRRGSRPSVTSRESIDGCGRSSPSSTAFWPSSSGGVRAVLGPNLVGVYLHGSFAVGGADEWSDADFLVVTEEPTRRGRPPGARRASPPPLRAARALAEAPRRVVRRPGAAPPPGPHADEAAVPRPRLAGAGVGRPLQHGLRPLGVPRARDRARWAAAGGARRPGVARRAARGGAGAAARVGRVGGVDRALEPVVRARTSCSGSAGCSRTYRARHGRLEAGGGGVGDGRARSGVAAADPGRARRPARTRSAAGTRRPRRARRSGRSRSCATRAARAADRASCCRRCRRARPSAARCDRPV